jgi:hypothetical protein
MAASLSEQLTAQFYEWEQYGRGWYVFDSPVELEPIFEPFWGHQVETPYVDDGKRHSILSYLSESIKGALSPRKETLPEISYESAPPQAYRYISVHALRGFSISMPQGEKLKAPEIEKFLVMLSYCQVQVSFEIIATHTSIRLQFVCAEPDALHIQSQLKAYFPTCILQDQTATLHQIINEESFFAIVDLGLQQEFTRPFAFDLKFEPDPLTGLYGVLEHLQEGEQAAVQILFKGAVNPWAESMLRAVSDNRGDSFFMDAPEMPKLAQEKISSPLFGVVIRVIGHGSTEGEAWGVLDRVGGALVQSSRSTYNMLIPLNNNGYPLADHQLDVLLRESRRGGMILNAKEISTFVHYPFAISSKKLERDIRKTKAAPKIAEGNEFILGRNVHQGVERIATLSPTQRLKHMHLIGATGTGKSTLLQSCIVQDIMLGNGVAVLDPHGDLIESILPYIPEHRQNDVVIVDPADVAYPVGFNILSAHSEVEKDILASDLVAVFRRLSTSFGDQMHSVLANAILAFLESSSGGTLIDLRRFLIEKQYREVFLKSVGDPNVVYYWQKEYPLLKSSSIGPILTRLDSFLRPKVIRNMVAQKKSLDFENILDTQKILFIKLSQGLIGTENSYLLGTFFVSKIYQAAMARQAQAKADRKDFFLYIDEFQNFITPSMSFILSGTRKYGLACILAHQDMIQLQKQDNELASAVISNAGTRVCFRLGDIDAKRFEDGFSSFEAPDLQNLGVGQAIVRIERPEYDFTIDTVELKEPTEEGIAGKEIVISLSREKYGTPREEVEKSLEYLRGEQQHEEIRQSVEEIKAVEPLKKQPQITVSETPDTVIEIPTLDEKQKAKTTENLVKQKELSQHRYLQTLIKKMAEARGYKATIEEPTPDGQGRVDVLLERGEKRIACEIGITTTKEWETHNIEKCLLAGYEIVIAVAVDKKAAEIMQKQISEKLHAKFQSQVFVLEADELFHYLDKEIAKEASTETRMKGYRVKVEYDSVSEEEHKKKRESVTKLVADSVKKKKDKQ